MQSISYGRVSRFLHWGMALLIISTILLVEFKDMLPTRSMKHVDILLHIQIGLFIFFLIWVRVIWRATHPIPPIYPPLSPVQHSMATAAHLLLYFMIATIPLLGVLALQSKGKQVDFLGMPLPVLLGEDIGLPYSLTIRSYHELFGNILIGLILFHMLAALIHHLFRRDSTLVRMLPWLDQRNGKGLIRK